MLLYSWNVNGIRANINKGTFLSFLHEKIPDILGLQEVKAKKEQLDTTHIHEIEQLGYQIIWNAAVRPGYSGTAILTKIPPKNITFGIDCGSITLKSSEEHLCDVVIREDSEWRVITAEYDNFYFVTVYTPNSKSALERLEYRALWDTIFLKYIHTLSQKKDVFVCGDLNVAHKEIDLTHPQSNRTTATRPGSAGFTDTERNGFQNIVDAGFIDTFRHFYPAKTESYTWWSNFGKAREKNVWWRIDYFLASEHASSRLQDAYITPEILGSDHCPVGVEIIS